MSRGVRQEPGLPNQKSLEAYQVGSAIAKLAWKGPWFLVDCSGMLAGLAEKSHLPLGITPHRACLESRVTSHLKHLYPTSLSRPPFRDPGILEPPSIQEPRMA